MKPKLAPPGAGLPLLQRLALRYWYGPVVSRRAKRSEIQLHYERLCTKLIGLVESVPAADRGTRILVPPQAALEDSSRYWSLNGVLEHLLIVNSAIEECILSLAAGKVPQKKADIAAVKPSESKGDQLGLFRDQAPGYLARINQKLAEPGRDADSALVFDHPWFGPLTAHQWYWLTASHLGIHYKQARQIVRGLQTRGA